MKTVFPMLLMFTSGCVSFATDAARLSQEDNIREAVFRYQFDHNASGQQKRATVYCLSVGEKHTDPSDEFMKRFADHKPPVRKVSACQTDPYKGVIDKRTGTPGLVFRVTGIRWISDNEVEASGGYYEAGLSSSGNTYAGTKQHGTWKVSSDKMNWISQSTDPFPLVTVEKSPLHSQPGSECKRLFSTVMCSGPPDWGIIWPPFSGAERWWNSQNEALPAV